VGDVNFGANTLTAGQYNASMVGGVFYLQLPTSKTVYIYRAVTAGDHVYTAHIAPQVAGASPAGTNGASCSFFVAANSGGRPDSANIALFGVESANANWHCIMRIGGVTVKDTTRAYDIPTSVATLDAFTGTQP
jgi:hypothetical protein